MNKILFTILLVAGLTYALGSCSSGAYNANPSSNANQSINPLNPLNAKQFTWAGTTKKVSLNFNGALWETDSAGIGWYDSLQTNVLWASDGKKLLVLYIKDGWGGHVYNMGYKQYNYLGEWVPDSASFYSRYESALGNSGELYMTANDTVNFCGKFYFQAVNAAGQIDNITNGIFTLTK
ncbi:MAG: hypothetical protein ACHP9Y_06180 [Gammaproteobacteria bacterium]